MTDLAPISEGREQDVLLDDVGFEHVRKIAFSDAGLSIPETKRAMVQSRLLRRLKATETTSFAEYLAYVETRGGSEERGRMISALTTNVSHFFREEHHFDTLQQNALPDLIQRAKSGGRVRFWSAGCSTGQEPYSLAITLVEAYREIPDLDVKILASDIDPNVLSVAKAGRYGERQTQSIPSDYRKRHFTEVIENGELIFEASDILKSLISFRQLNLIEPWPMSGQFDAIFCRNVVIYFSEETQKTLWPRFRNSLAPEGYFFLGHSERVQDPNAAGFDPVGVTTYRRAAATN